MAQLASQLVAATGLAPALVAASAGGDKFKNPSNAHTFLVVKNASGASINVTIAKQKANVNVPGGGVVPISDLVVAVPAASERWIGPFFDTHVDVAGDVNVAYSAVATVTVAVFTTG